MSEQSEIDQLNQQLAQVTRERDQLHQEQQAIKDLVGDTEWALRQRVVQCERERACMTVYLILKVGVYIQAICGIYTDEEIAKREAQRRAQAEPDDYHTIQVVAATTNSGGSVDCHTPAIAAFTGQKRPGRLGKPPYPFCRHPAQCVGRSSCPDDPTCAE